MKLFFKNLKEKEEENYFWGSRKEKKKIQTKHGLTVVFLSTTATTTDKQSWNYALLEF